MGSKPDVCTSRSHPSSLPSRLHPSGPGTPRRRKHFEKVRLGFGLIWALPYTLVGLAVGALGLATGGGWQRRGRTLEFHGGWTTRFVRNLPARQSIAAITLGHTVLGQTRAVLDQVRSHEAVHVRQFERWGPFMGPAYLLASLWLWLGGGEPYWDNPFEREAYSEGCGRKIADGSRPSPTETTRRK